MEARILKSDGTLGKKIYQIDVPADMYPIQRRLNKILLGVGKWRNSSVSFFTVLSGKHNAFFSIESIREIILWMGNVKEKD